MPFFTVDKILQITSILLTTYEIIRERKKDQTQSELTTTMVINLQVNQNPSQDQKAFRKNDNYGIGLLLIVLICIGVICYPYRQFMVLMFSLFWWLVLIIVFRFTNKRFITPKGHSLILIALMESVVTLLLAFFVDYFSFEWELINQLYTYLVMGLSALSYALLIIIGSLVIICCVTDSKSKYSKIASKMLYKFLYLSAICIIAATFLLCCSK